MPMPDWIHNYPKVRALLQTDEDVLEDASLDTTPDASEIEQNWRRREGPLPLSPSPFDAIEAGDTAHHLLQWHLNRLKASEG